MAACSRTPYCEPLRRESVQQAINALAESSSEGDSDRVFFGGRQWLAPNSKVVLYQGRHPLAWPSSGIHIALSTAVATPTAAKVVRAPAVCTAAVRTAAPRHLAPGGASDPGGASNPGGASVAVGRATRAGAGRQALRPMAISELSARWHTRSLPPPSPVAKEITTS